ncbi:MAG: O-antigen ligase family protein [Lachnospiraceae bacterium]|nr:O-antigen ligase family protein [Lachnospiraceae bacterium]
MIILDKNNGDEIMERGNRKEIAGQKKERTIINGLQQEVVTIYVFLIMVVYPFYYQNKYYNIGYAKWKFFLVLTLGTGLILIVAAFLTLFKKKHKLITENKQREISTVDCFALVYLAVALLSTLISPYIEQVIWGYSGWYMGLVAQICFVFIYYFVSRYWTEENFVIKYGFATAFLVFLLAVLMRFGFDPLGMYTGVEERYMLNFLSTIGQVTWYSSYVAILLPLGVFAFWFYDNRYMRFGGGIFTAVGFMTVVTLGSDSIFFAVGILFGALLWVSIVSNKKFLRFLEVLIICFGSFSLVGVFKKMFAEREIQAEAFAIFFTEGKITGIFLIITIAFYICLKKIKNGSWLDARKIREVRGALSIVILGIAVTTVVYVYLNTVEVLPEHVRNESTYLLFNEYWGNNRGFSWIVAVKSFLKGDVIRKLFGCGPDGFSLYIQSFFREELSKKWGGSGMLACAHNEWLNTLVNMGIAGFVTYIGIFLSALWRFCKKSEECPELMALAMSVMCYMGHNFFCYQQVVCTPVIFILIGVGEAIIRNKKQGDITGHITHSN